MISHPQDTYDVAVVGSGPASSSAAIELARSGLSVVVIEKAKLPRYKTCGGGIVRRAIKLLPDTFTDGFERFCYTAELHLHDLDLHFVTRREEPVVAMTMRSDFDFHLVTAAKIAGASIRMDCEVIDIRQRSDEVTLTTTQDEICSRFVIAADGALSTVAKKAGWRETRSLIPALEQEIYIDRNEFETYSQSARFDIGIIPYGYAWTFPKKDHLSIGVLTIRKDHTNLNDHIDKYISKLAIRSITSIEKHGYIIPIKPRSDGFVKGRIVLVGDAAGLADPLTGEGISFALMSGKFAADAIIEGESNPVRVDYLYTQRLREEILPEIRISTLLSKLFYNPTTRKWLFRRYGLRLTEAIADVIVGVRTYREIIRNPKTYWRLLIDLIR